VLVLVASYYLSTLRELPGTLATSSRAQLRYYSNTRVQYKYSTTSTTISSELPTSGSYVLILWSTVREMVLATVASIQYYQLLQ
jgi:hypothetical protein